MPTILHVTDMQRDFGAQDGVLSVPGGAEVAEGIDQFMDDVPAGVFQKAIFTYDTHPWFSYFSSPECIPFPAIHCEQGREGWELVVDPSKMDGKAGIYFAPKETFDFWEDKATDNITLKSGVGPNSHMGHVMFQKTMNEAGYEFLPRDADRAAFAAAVEHDFDAAIAPYAGDITVIGYDAQKGKGKEGYYIKKSEEGTEIIALADQRLIDVYNNVGKLANDKECLDAQFDRNDLPADMSDYKVVMTGLATNFCVFDAMLGYLERGAKVFAIEDLMSGIPNGPEGQQALIDITGVDRTASGDIRDVMKTDHFKPFVDNGQLVLLGSKDFLVFANNMTQKQPITRRFPKP